MLATIAIAVAKNIPLNLKAIKKIKTGKISKRNFIKPPT
jgi:hypothetical protein